MRFGYDDTVPFTTSTSVMYLNVIWRTERTLARSSGSTSGKSDRRETAVRLLLYREALA